MIKKCSTLLCVVIIIIKVGLFSFWLPCRLISSLDEEPKVHCPGINPDYFWISLHELQSISLTILDSFINKF